LTLSFSVFSGFPCIRWFQLQLNHGIRGIHGKAPKDGERIGQTQKFKLTHYQGIPSKCGERSERTGIILCAAATARHAVHRLFLTEIETSTFLITLFRINVTFCGLDFRTQPNNYWGIGFDLRQRYRDFVGVHAVNTGDTDSKRKCK